jgi:hypothetical protein
MMHQSYTGDQEVQYTTSLECIYSVITAASFKSNEIGLVLMEEKMVKGSVYCL